MLRYKKEMHRGEFGLGGPGRRRRVKVLFLLNLLVAVVFLVHVAPLSGQPAGWSVPRTTDPLRAAKAITRQQLHGSADDLDSPGRLSEIALDRRIRVTCGTVSLWAVGLLRKAGFDARLVMVMTLDAWNATNNGHTFIEIRSGGRWIAYDLDRKVRWTDEAGRPLSMSEWMARVPSGNYRIVPLLRPVDERVLRAEDLRLAQVPFVRWHKLLWFPSQGERTESLLKYPRAKNYRVLPPRVWEARFGERLPSRSTPAWWPLQDGRLH
jgi:hypothetical protein